MDVETLEARYVDRARRYIGPDARTIDVVLPDRRLAPDAGGTALAGWWVDEATAGDRIVLPNPYESLEAITTMEAWVWSVVERLAPWIGEIVDAAARRPAAGPEYWRTLLSPWLVHLTSALADRRLFCLAACAVAPGAPLIAPVVPDPPATTSEALSRLRGDEGNAGLLAVLAPLLGLSTARAPGSASPPPGAHAAARKLRGRDLLGAASIAGTRALLASLPRRRLALVGPSSLTPADLLRLEAKLGGIAPLPRPALRRSGARSAPIDWPARARLQAPQTSDPLEWLATQALSSLLPRSLLEDFDQVRADSARAYGRSTRNVVLAGYSIDERQNEFIGRCRAGGRRLAFVQHGGMYLQAPVNAQERLEVEPGSPFLSWGARGPGVRPSPHPYLERLRASHRGGERITLVEALEPPDAYVVRFAGHPLANQGYEMARMLAEMVRRLPPRVRPHLALKRFPNPTGVPARPAELEVLPSQGPSGGAPAWMAVSRLAVIPYLDTPFIESILIGTPTIGLWDPARWPVLDELAPLFARMQAARIVHADPAAAAAHVDSVYDEVGRWWDAPDVIACRIEFLERFAVAGDWLEAWAEALRALGG